MALAVSVPGSPIRSRVRAFLGRRGRAARISGLLLLCVALSACATERRSRRGDETPTPSVSEFPEAGQWEEVIGEAALADLTADGDGDGLLSEREIALGTDPDRADTDGDGFDDAFEDLMSEFGFDPLAPTLDADRDGLADRFEQTLGTSPREPDTDEDGWGDLDEVMNASYGYDPLRTTVDADFDGLADALEAELGLSTENPNTDGDHLGDFAEYAAGLDPAVPDRGGNLGELVGSTYSQAMAKALETVRLGGAFPATLAGELPYPRVTAPLVEAGAMTPSAALMQQAVYNPHNSPGLYDTYQEIVQKIRRVARDFDGNPRPRIVRLFRWSRRTVDCCTPAGANKAGRRLYALKISDNPRRNEDEPEILFMGMHHARELVTTTITVRLIQHLTDRYAAGDPAIKSLVDNAEIWIIPIVNPDGYTLAVGGQRNWRKNARRVRDGALQALATRGVDLNRNYDFEHVRKPGVVPHILRQLARHPDGPGGSGLFNNGNPNIADSAYAGPRHFSEVETRAVTGLAQNRFRTGSEVSGLKCSLSWHTAVGVVGHSLFHTPMRAADALTGAERRRLGALAGAVANATPYRNVADGFQSLRTPGDEIDGYPAYGTSEDWLFRGLRVLSILVEAYAASERNGVWNPYFYPPNQAGRDLVANNNVRGGLALIQACCGADFGDADPRYPVRNRKAALNLGSSDNGAWHARTGQEWFGRFLVPAARSVSVEMGADDPDDPDGVPNLRRDLQAWDLDRFDDGVRFFPLTYRPGRQGKVEFTVCVDQPGNRYDPADPDKTLYVNAWIDWDTDQQWEEGNNEHILDGVRLAPKDISSWGPLGSRNAATTVTQTQSAIDGKCAKYEATFPVGRRFGTKGQWARFRLDYGEDVGRNDPRPRFRSDQSLRTPTLAPGAIQPAGRRIGYAHGKAWFGEVEDYLLGSDFGDAPDPHKRTPGKYPTRKANQGGRHLVFQREWLGPGRGLASATRETDGCDTTAAEVDGVPNLAGGCKLGDADRKDDGASIPAFVQPGQKILVRITPTARSAAFGFTNRGPGGQDSRGKMTLKPNCLPGPIADVADTPVPHRDRGRYAAWDPERRLYLRVWADWNANGAWEPSELVVSGPLDPEDWGGDGRYTLGEPFTDADGNGVWTPGEAFTDLVGVTRRQLTCKVVVPDTVAQGERFFWRVRLDYGEDGVTNDDVGHHATEENRAYRGPRGGALWGEVEDYPCIAEEVDQFAESDLMFFLETPDGAEMLTVTGPSTFVVDIANVTDTDGDGREQAAAEMVRMDLSGEGAVGPVAVRLRDPAATPHQRSTGEIEETAAGTPGLLDLPPFTRTGTAESTFRLFLEVQIGDRVYHNQEPLYIEEIITHKPPRKRETYTGGDRVRLFDEAGNPTDLWISEPAYTPEAGSAGYGKAPPWKQ